ncbi:sensor histidine kinase [Desulfoglaeba alkanexedens]|uniref:histidine kinase n=1 Tax=Desulfoglaeba alkanexedens ALDC TaxID=980445 RepID=A0A4P8L3W7_9BACT|nr:ATP-binding protein [Desulfoglaeba alkanexedens]QCQ22560.1 HAMP domain-containing protein [Desulfoglaeba alkanexedens ALDC]
MREGKPALPGQAVPKPGLANEGKEQRTMRELTIFKRLILGYLAILLVVIAIGVYSILSLGQLNQIIRSISSIDSETIRMANRLRDFVLTQRGFEKKYVVSKDGDFHRQFLETEKYIEKHLERISVLMDTAEERRLIADVKAFHSQYLSIAQEEVRLINSNKTYSQEIYNRKKEDLADQIIRKLEEVTKIAEADMDSKIKMSGKIGYQASRVTAILTIAAVIMALMIAFFTARTINSPIVELIRGTKQIAGGTFEKHVTIASPPEINELAEAFNHMCDRLKELDEMKADLISHISHEFRTPLAVIREAVSLHRDCISTGAMEKQLRLVGIIEEECERLINSVNKVLSLSRMDAGMMDYHIEGGSLSQIIEMSASKIRPIAERKRIALNMDVAQSLPYAAIDTEKISQVLDNLLDNALKFTPEGGKVLIRAAMRDRKPSGDQEKGFIEVSVSDTGCGIPAENIQEIFDKFKKLHAKGTGLGLYIARQIVRAHGGDIWVKSGEKAGTTFFFTVPVF